MLEIKLCKCDKTEPPLVRSRIPIIGHLLGLGRFGVSYYKQLRHDFTSWSETTKLPILTIGLASQKLYIVNSPTLISQINRRQKVIDGGPPFLEIVFGKLFAFSSDDMMALSKDSPGNGTLRGDTQALEHSLLARGMGSLDEIFDGIITAAAYQLPNLPDDGQRTIELGAWLQEALPMSTAIGLFGPDNPFSHDPSLLQSFWEFEGGLKALTMGLFPSLTASGPMRARRRLVEAFKSYVGTNKNYTATGQMPCQLVHGLGEVAKRHDRDDAYLSRYLFASFSAFTINTVPVTFWCIGHIAIDQALLSEIRNELNAALASSSWEHSVETGTGPRDIWISISALREHCPVLVSTLNEVLRYVSSSTGTMMVHEDTWINDQYWLKKGALVQMAAYAIHSDTKNWGQNAPEFVPRRFLETADEPAHPSAFRTFGGGNTLCPGRHLACDEILAFTAMFLYSFDIATAPETPKLPQRNDTNMLSVLKPKGPFKLVISKRSKALRVAARRTV
ncbi:hypothetical protein PFICI_10195 [Pestalotiopsis fici W106-1]|uniref:Cytochrome P450 n=1 Tax=Pestalotiopsis fici (strain W106-1 / CGMCC3.15140) TaxID=1229662 RepID=W3WW78_PESFW|nr:uncharacterized protein PFICI_10195 [Pestalotiopsis fici W106-1]ETS78133.1 hypothetical protein PFICI_10195 [Pestalotiopsis fici W106-1]